MKFEVVASPEDFASAYIERFRAYVPKLMSIAPFFTVLGSDGEKVVVKTTAIGRKGRYEIRGTLRPLVDEGSVLVSVKPLFPMYLLALISPLAEIEAVYPKAIVIDAAKDEAWAKLTLDRDAAVAGLAEAATKYDLLEPSDFDPDTTGVSYEGYLYRTPAGYVAFISKVEGFEYVDEIVEHEEDKAMIGEVEDRRVMPVYDLMERFFSLGLGAIADLLGEPGQEGSERNG